MTFHRVAMLAAISVLALVAGAPEAQAVSTPISSCGQTVTNNAALTQDLYCPGSDGVVIGAPNITIDLKGHTLRGNRGLSDYGIDNSAGFVGVTVKNGVVRNFGYGVIGSNSQDPSDIPNDMTVSNILASGNQIIGIFIGGDHAVVKSSVAVGNNNVGVFISGSFARIQSTTTSGNDQGGVHVDGNGAKIQSSTVSGNDGHGISVAGDAAVVTGNHAEGNGYAGTSTDSNGLGITVTNYTTPPTGKNTSRGNDDPAECNPTFLC